MSWTWALAVALFVVGVPPFLYLCARFVTIGVLGGRRDYIKLLKDRRTRNGKQA